MGEDKGNIKKEIHYVGMHSWEDRSLDSYIILLH